MFDNEKFDTDKFGEFFPHMENILHFGTYYNDVENGVIRWSPGFFKILGLNPNEVSSTVENFHQYVHPEDIELVKRANREAIELRRPYHIEFTIINALGIKKRVFAENYMKFDETGKLVSYNGLLKDITEKYEYQQQLQSQIQQLDKSNRNLQEFVYVASHDLQEPLRKIATFSDRLQARYGGMLDDEGNRYIARIAAGCSNMQVLLEDLLDFSKLSFSDKVFEKINIEEVINNTLSDLELKIEEANAEVICTNPAEVEGYPSQMRQLFTNLIQNSIKFKRNDTPLQISIDCSDVFHTDYPDLNLSKSKVYIKIEVADNGIGFGQEFAEKIFMIFQRLHGKVEYPGSGIGLSICKKIVENHEGFIFAEGTLNQGAKFTILLPQNQA